MPARADAVLMGANERETIALKNDVWKSRISKRVDILSEERTPVCVPLSCCLASLFSAILGRRVCQGSEEREGPCRRVAPRLTFVA
jgi:hypothetical protein